MTAPLVAIAGVLLVPGLMIEANAEWAIDSPE
jgi:hypothetical protein